MNDELPCKVIQQTCTLLVRIPLEILREIVSQVHDLKDRQILRITCHTFRALVKPAKHQELLDFERSAFGNEKDLYACRYCRRARPADEFSDNERRGRKAKWPGTARAQRFCIECGLQPWTSPRVMHYTSGPTFTCNGTMFLVCMECNECKEVDGSADACGLWYKYCQTCWQRLMDLKERQHEERQAGKEYYHMTRRRPVIRRCYANHGHSEEPIGGERHIQV